MSDRIRKLPITKQTEEAIFDVLLHQTKQPFVNRKMTKGLLNEIFLMIANDENVAKLIDDSETKG